MFRRRSKGWTWLVLPVAAAAFFVGATLFFYRGTYSPPARVEVPLERITPSDFNPRRFAEVPLIRSGTLVLDNAHNNAFRDEELSTLISKVASRGFDVEFLMRRDLPFPTANPLARLVPQLSAADSFVVVLPTIPYTPAELDVVQGFLTKGGRLLLIGDPGRSNSVNSMADRFGILFEAGYLYNVVEHDLNFRNIYVRDFRPDQVTDGLTAIALYNAGSVKSTGAPLAFTDSNTFSSMVKRVEPFSPLAKSADGQILAISDLTFLRPPENTTLDNDRLVSNVADFLTTGERRFDLSDFPHFFQGDVEILVGSPGLFDAAARVKHLLSEFRTVSEVRGVEDLTTDTLFLGLYQDSSAVAQYLDSAGIQVDDTLRTRFTPDIDAAGTGILVLHKGHERRVLVVLGHSQEALRRLVDRLELDIFRSGLVSGSLGVYQLQ